MKHSTSYCRERLDAIPRRVPWYPGSEKRYTEFKAKFKGAQELGQVSSQPAPASCKPWLFEAGLTPEQVPPPPPHSFPSHCFKALNSPRLLLLILFHRGRQLFSNLSLTLNQLSQPFIHHSIVCSVGSGRGGGGQHVQGNAVDMIPLTSPSTTVPGGDGNASHAGCYTDRELV